MTTSNFDKLMDMLSRRPLINAMLSAKARPQVSNVVLDQEEQDRLTIASAIEKLEDKTALKARIPSKEWPQWQMDAYFRQLEERARRNHRL